jgi:hypothetical protein
MNQGPQKKRRPAEHADHAEMNQAEQHALYTFRVLSVFRGQNEILRVPSEILSALNRGFLPHLRSSAIYSPSAGK